MNLRNVLEKKGVYAYNVGNRDFFTYWTRPKYAADIECKVSNISDVAIVIQGPIQYEDDFTVETVKLYKKMFPNCEIILTTWSNEDKKVLDRIEEAGAVVLLSDMPKVMTGIDYSVNLQRKNSQRGILYAKEKGYSFCAKTRTDQRIYEGSVLEFCIHMLKKFPIVDSGVMAKGRIISTSMGTFDNRFYNVSDLFLFGYTDDMLRYYSCPEDTREHTNEKAPEDKLLYSKRRTGEIWFSTHYIEAIGHKLLWTKEDNDYAMGNYYIIVDAESIDLFWRKYTRREYRWRTYSNRELGQVTFSDWYLMYCNN